MEFTKIQRKGLVENHFAALSADEDAELLNGQYIDLQFNIIGEVMRMPRKSRIGGCTWRSCAVQ